MSNRILIVGGTSGIGLALANRLTFAPDKPEVIVASRHDSCLFRSQFVELDLRYFEESDLNEIGPIDELYITAGLGYLNKFESMASDEISAMIRINFEAVTKLIHYYFRRMISGELKKCVVVTSISSYLPTPLMSVYSATKAALTSLIHNLNYELMKTGSDVQIIEVAPGNIPYTRFNGNQDTNLEKLYDLATEIIEKSSAGQKVIIPNMEVYGNVLIRAKMDPVKFALDSYDYKLGRKSKKSIVGYMTGCFDLFHIGHLNIIRRAKEQCDYLVIGLHKDGSHKGKELAIPYDERREILLSLKYVDEVIMSTKEDTDPKLNGSVEFDKLFVGSDYKGSKKFEKYEEQAKEYGFEIVYLPYTESTSSTMLRNFIAK